jgi:hypothetical protein
MKKIFGLITLVMVLALVSPASAVDQTGKFAVGGYGGYSFGFGDKFKEYEYMGFTSQNKLNFSFGGKVKYGLTPNIALVGGVDYQSGKWEGKLAEYVPPELAGGGLEESMNDSESDESFNWIGILAGGMYVFSPEATTSPYVTAGGGFYVPDEGDSKPGFNVGFGVEHFFQDNLALDGGARFHMIFFKSEDESDGGGSGAGAGAAASDDEIPTWDNATYVQIYVGLTFYLGVQ